MVRVKLYIHPKLRNHAGLVASVKDSPRMSRPTIEDVARLAGVSIATVSRGLHFPDRLAPATRERVLAAVRATGYTLNTAAQSLRQRRANTVLVVVPGIGNTFFSEILGGIEAGAADAGMTMLIGDSGRVAEREAAYVRYLLNGRADGALLLAEPQADWFAIPRRNVQGVAPVVIISEVAAGHPGPAVTIDNEAAAAAAVGHLVSLGHRRIAHVTGPTANILTRQRVAGYRRALAAAGIAWQADLEWPGDFGLTGGRAALAAFAAMDRPPTAVFCANDESAMGFISAAHLAGVRVPQDVSVMGFDDIHFAQAFSPALSTIRQPRSEMGTAAMRLLLALLADAAPGPVALPFTLMPRDSTAPPPP